MSALRSALLSDSPTRPPSVHEASVTAVGRDSLIVFSNGLAQSAAGPNWPVEDGGESASDYYKVTSAVTSVQSQIALRHIDKTIGSQTHFSVR